MAIPYTPTGGDQAPWSNLNPVQGTPPAAIVANTTVTTPTSATLIPGLTQSVSIQQYTDWLLIHLSGKSATVTAGATITIGAYTGATTGALTTLFMDTVSVVGTGATTVAVAKTFMLPVTPAMWNTTIFISIAATATTGNFVLNATATEPTQMLVLAI